MTRHLEVCCADVQSLRAAVEGGAYRVELCSALSLDGLTPSKGFIRMAVETGIRVHVLIRPREGNFIYSEEEVQCMLYDIETAKACGAHGVVFGALTEEGLVDLPVCRELVAASEGMDITFHRAFDVCKNPLQALVEIAALGCTRILSSGQARSAEEGIPLLREMVKATTGTSLSILPGAGVNAENAALILNETGATEIHGSLRIDGHTSAPLVQKVVSTICG